MSLALKTFFVLLIILALGIFITLECLDVIKWTKHFSRFVLVRKITAIVLLVVIAIPFLRYAWPFNISVEFEEFAQLKSKEQIISVDENDDWYCIYDIGWFSEYSNTSYWGWPRYEVEGGYPELELDKYTYLISFERKVISLSYNVWDCKEPPIVDLGKSTKWGTAVLSDEITPNVIYVYRFPKKAIDNINVTKYAD